MKLNERRPAEGSTEEAFRVGRGAGSGNGKTAGKGQKGQNARSGGGVRVGFEGGQMPIYRRLPKRGFNNFRFTKTYQVVNVGALNDFAENAVITSEELLKKGLISDVTVPVKFLGDGEIEVKGLTVKAAKFSATAVQKIEAAGGKAEVL
jgi:large subunit ribosomal protein L15